MAIGRAAWELMFQVSPILLTGGRLSGMLPSWLPAVPILSATAVPNLIGVGIGAIGGSIPTSLDEAFAQFQPQPGATVLDQQIATYPFANQTVAANSIIQQPCHISFQMTCPARGPLSYIAKLAQMEALIQALYWHNQNGGTYTLLNSVVHLFQLPDAQHARHLVGPDQAGAEHLDARFRAAVALHRDCGRA